METRRKRGFIDLPNIPKHEHQNMPLVPRVSYQSNNLLNVPGNTKSRRNTRLSISTERMYRLRTKPQPKFVLENTYKLEPNLKERFCPIMARQIIDAILEKRLGEVKYDPHSSSGICSELSEEIKGAIKSAINGRYKVVCFVMISENRKQELRYVSRSVWDAEVDNYATSTFWNTSLNAVVTVFALYYD